MMSGRNRVYHRKYCNGRLSGNDRVDGVQEMTYLRRADFVEDNERERLHEPCEREVALSLAKEQTRAKRQRHLRHEARQRRADDLPPQRQLNCIQGVLCGRVGEVDEVEVGREVVSVVESVQVV